jgi:hypothetical protein
MLAMVKAVPDIVNEFGPATEPTQTLPKSAIAPALNVCPLPFTINPKMIKMIK